MEYQRCSKGLWDTTIPGIKFDSEGVSNFCKMQESLMAQYPRGEKGLQDWTQLVDKMKRNGKRKKYDCIIGVSGGTDSCYLLHIANEYGLRVLAVNLDNGWSSDVAVKNIKAVTSALNFDLETFVINYDDVKTVLKSYIYAGLPWIDSPTDIAIKSVLYKAALREGIKFVLNGADFRSEGKQPLNWTYSDTKQLKYIVSKFSGERVPDYPTLPIYKIFYYGFIRNIQVIRPLYYLSYEKKKARDLLKRIYGWIDYGGHHYENLFTKFAISYWLPVKFNIDKRIITYSAQVLSNEIKREEALDIISKQSYNKETISNDIAYVLKKLDIKQSDFDVIINGPNYFFFNYPSYYSSIKKFSKIGKYLSHTLFGFKPGIFEAIDQGL